MMIATIAERSGGVDDVKDGVSVTIYLIIPLSFALCNIFNRMPRMHFNMFSCAVAQSLRSSAGVIQTAVHHQSVASSRLTR